MPGGQCKRTNIGIALVSNPRVLFLDEPTSGLDSYTANEVCSLQPSPTRCSRAATDALAVTCQHMPAFPDSRGPTLQTHFECLALA